MSTKPALGKGLASLIPHSSVPVPSAASSTPGNGLITLSIDKIRASHTQPRKTFHEAALKELADSIRVQGIIQPIIVRSHHGHYEIIAGERRFRAAKLAGLKEVPVVIKSISDRQTFELALIENIQRQDLNPIEEAMAYQKLLEDYKLTHEEISERVGKDRSSITNALRLLKLPRHIQDMIVDESLSAGHARVVVSLETPELQDTLVKEVIAGQLSVRKTEALAKTLGASGRNKKIISLRGFRSAHLQALEDNLKRRLETKVAIQHGNTQGTIVIHYKGNDELERITQTLLK